MSTLSCTREMHPRRLAITERMIAIDEDIVFLDGFDDAIVGVAVQHTKKPVVVYDRARCIEILMERDGMPHDEAEEFFGFNTECVWVGEQTPMFLDKCDEG